MRDTWSGWVEMFRTLVEVALAVSLILAITEPGSKGASGAAVRQADRKSTNPFGAFARVGDVVITQTQIADALRRANSTDVHAAVDRILDREVLYAAALRAGVDVEPAVCAAVRDLIASTYLARLNMDDVALTEEEVRSWYRANRGCFDVPARRSAAVIRVSESGVGGGRSESNLLARVMDVRGLALTNEAEDFGPLAARFSDHAGSRFRGGRVGWLLRDEKGLPPEVVSTMFELGDVGEISGPIRASDGYWLVRLLDVVEAGVASFETVAARARDAAEREAAHDRRAQLMEALSLQADVWIDTNAIEALGLELGQQHTERTPVPAME